MPSRNTGNKISSIKILKDKVVIKTYDETRIELPKEVFTSFYLFKGKELSEKEIKDIYKEKRIFELYKYARKISTTRVYSEHKMREKLYLKSSSTSDVNEVINKLKKAGLINDAEFVKEYVEYANERNIGKNKIKAKLQEKGVFNEEISKIRFDDRLELKKAKTYLELINRKFDKYNYQAKKEHATKYLIGQGFDLNIALEVADMVEAPKHKDDLKKLKVDYDKVCRQCKGKYTGHEYKEKVVASLLRKGYKINDIMNMWEDR